MSGFNRLRQSKVENNTLINDYQVTNFEGSIPHLTRNKNAIYTKTLILRVLVKKPFWTSSSVRACNNEIMVKGRNREVGYNGFPYGNPYS